MALLRPAFAILLALFGTIADAGPQAVPRKYQAGFYLDGCNDFLAGRSNFLSGRCVGAAEILGELGSDNKLFCLPDAVSNLEQVRVIVTYIEGLPKRMTDGFGLLANEAIAEKLAAQNLICSSKPCFAGPVARSSPGLLYPAQL